MKAAVLYGKDDIRYSDWDDPIAEPGYVKIQVKSCGICGSDVPRVLGDAAHYFPIILGHEFSGVVAETGEGVSSVVPGDHVTAAPLIPCKKCPDCEKGNYSLCKNYTFTGSRINGAMAEYICVPESNVVKLDPDIPFIIGATFEPSTVSLHALKLVDFRPGKSVAVVGCGIIGNFLLQWARIYGASRVAAVGRSENGLKAAKKLDVDAVFNSSEDSFKSDIQDFTNGRGFDYVFEAAGSESAMKQAMDIAGNRSYVCFVGTPKNQMTFSVQEWEKINRKEMFVTGSWMSYSVPFPGTEWIETADRFADQKLKTIPEMIYKTYKLSEVREAFDNFKEPGKVKGRIILINE